MSVMYHEEKFRIHKDNSDYKKNLTMFATLDFFQDLATMNAKEIGVGFDKLFSMGYFWVVMYEEIERIGKCPIHCEDVICKSWPHARGRLEFEREYEMTDLDGNLIIKGISNWVLMDVNTRGISRGDDVVFEGEYYDRTNYTEKCKRKIGLKETTFELEIDYKVSITDLDDNQHMNNAKYLNIIQNMESIDNYRLWKKCAIAFIHEARLGDIIHVGRYKNENNQDCYRGFVNGEPCFDAVIDWEE